MHNEVWGCAEILPLVCLSVVGNLCSFANCLRKDKTDYMVSEKFLISHHFWNSLLCYGLLCRPWAIV